MEQFFYDIGAWMEAIGGWAYLIAPLVMAGVAILPIPAEAPVTRATLPLHRSTLLMS